MKNLIFEKYSSYIGILKINRPEVLNAINRATLEEMLDFLRNKIKQEECRSLIITGAGEKSFIAGADIKEMKEMTPTELLEFTRLGQEVTIAISKAPMLVIAAVNGYALGGGFEMALACDFIIASKSAKFGLPEVSLGTIPGFGGTQRLSRIVGTRLAKELVMSGRTFNAEEAHTYRIVNHIVENEALIKECSVISSEIIRHSFFAILQAKRSIDAGYSLSIEEALELERNMCAVCFATEECSEAMNTFLERHHKG